MRKLPRLLLLLLFIFISNYSYSQFYLGGNAYLYKDINASSQDSDYESTRIGVYPSFGFFTNERILIGAGFGYSTFKTDYSYVNINEHNKFSIYGSIRSYHPIVERVSFFLNLRLGYGFGKEYVYDYYYPEKIEVNVNSFESSFTPGLNIELTKRINMEIGVGVLSYSYHVKEEIPEFGTGDRMHDHDLDLRLNYLGLGISYVFGDWGY